LQYSTAFTSAPTATLFFFFGDTGVWTFSLMLARQALLLLEPLHQPFFFFSFSTGVWTQGLTFVR
jgi:hypothetical protein